MDWILWKTMNHIVFTYLPLYFIIIQWFIFQNFYIKLHLLFSLQGLLFLSGAKIKRSDFSFSSTKLFNLEIEKLWSILDLILPISQDILLTLWLILIVKFFEELFDFSWFQFEVSNSLFPWQKFQLGPCCWIEGYFLTESFSWEASKLYGNPYKILLSFSHYFRIDF